MFEPSEERMRHCVPSQIKYKGGSKKHQQRMSRNYTTRTCQMWLTEFQGEYQVNFIYNMAQHILNSLGIDLI